MNSWNGKPYHSLDFHLKEMFGRKVYKLALDGGMTCQLYPQILNDLKRAAQK